MKNKLRFGLAAASIAVICTSPAHAFLDDILDNASSNGGDFFEDVFFGGSFGQADFSDYCNNAADCNSGDTSWKVYGGYKINETFDVEVGYHSIADISKTATTGTVTSEVSAITANAVGKYEINENIQAFGKIGVSSWGSDNSANGNADGIGLTYGIGAKVHMNETMKIRAEWERIGGVETGSSENDVNIISLGIEISGL